jgi:acetylglutamate kinase
MVLNGQTNTELVTLLNRSGTNAIGLSGMDASFLKSKLSPDSSVDSPRGEVTSINTELLELFLQRNYVPVVSPVGFLDDGTTVPLEPDQVASELAVAAKASKLVYLVGVPGFTEDDSLLGQLTTTILSTKIAAGLFKPSIGSLVTLG